ncbi:MAG: AMP-dependent synthetase [Roseovarius sp. BRH_c41]|uniref:class I adenylate-forming enzyme family protein n=1 Tax=Roseovarius sp. BRH_c41 TaxID=1629709 RepID=UPI0005F2101E|nr:AMP-binding protein [Roseovarius sp. BRH_c41]KJS45739.1 MAG: AMP-dependent synthetase [Roseovarius sp. BRH_c41]
MNIGIWLERAARAWPAREALFQGVDVVADYAGFDRAAREVAGGLMAQGVVAGDRVAIFMGNAPEYLLALYGIWYAGAAAVPINAKLHGAEAAWIIADAGAAVVLADAARREALAAEGVAAQAVARGEAVAEVETRAPEDLAWLFYTSGTTGRPKGVRITHRMLVAMSLSYLADVDEVTGADATLYAAPMSHGAGLYAMVHVLRGARHVCPASGGFDEAEIFDLARHHDRVHMFAAPTMVKRLTARARVSGETVAGLRSVVYAGGPMYLADILEAVEVFGPVFLQIYGQGECPMAITALSRVDVADRSHPRWRERLASVGRAQSVGEVRIADETGAEVPPGEVGEILVRGDAVMPGYWQNVAASEKALRGGWLWTGDLGRMDGDGYVTLQDRSKDMIISGGSNIYPREVEEVLLTHPSVIEVAVVGQMDAEWGEIVVAFVVCDGELDEAALDAHCLNQIARFKRPKRYIAVAELPKNNYGKVLKTELRGRFAE